MFILPNQQSDQDLSSHRPSELELQLAFISFSQNVRVNQKGQIKSNRSKFLKVNSDRPLKLKTLMISEKNPFNHLKL